VAFGLLNASQHYDGCFLLGMWDRNSGHGLDINLLPDIHIMYLYTHCWEQMKSVGGHGSLLLQFVMKVMV